VHSTWWALCNLIDVSQGEDITEARCTRLQKQCGRAFKAEKQLDVLCQQMMVVVDALAKARLLTLSPHTVRRIHVFSV
jgi:hypothetical protein